MKAYVQIKNGEFQNQNAYNAWRGFGLLGYEVKTFDIAASPLAYKRITRETPFFAGVGPHKKILREHLGIDKPELSSYPDSLKSFLGRNVRVAPMIDIRRDITKCGPVFIKPLDEDAKYFSGHTIKESNDFAYTICLPDDYEVWVSEIVDFVIEYRVFIHKGKILDSRSYRGDFRKNIDYNIVEEAIKQFRDAPVAYCLDFGLTADGKTLLVEVTDAKSLGCYGLDSTYYGRMLVDRWEELMK